MPDNSRSQVMMHPDRYIEMTFFGMQSADQLQKLIAKARQMAEAETSPINLLIDARAGRVGRDPRSLSLMLGVGRVKNLQNVIILLSDDPHNMEGAKESGMIISVLTSALRLRPVYAYDEAEARQLAII